MAEENIISVTNNENPPINLEIVNYKNEVGVSYIQGKGDKGEKGDTGEKGDKGEKGDLGVSTMLVSSFTGAINGSNNTFILNDNYDDVIVFINGIKYNSADYTYTKSTKTVVFGFAIPTGYTLEFYGITNKTVEMVPLENLSSVASNGSYFDLIDTPSIPNKTSDLRNDSGFVTDSMLVSTVAEMADALTEDLAPTVANSHTHSNSTALSVVSGTNTGDETASSIKSKLGITTLSGSNTGDQDLSGLVSKTTTVNGRALSSNISITATDVGAPTISSGTTAPSSTPAKVGDIYVDTTNFKTYVSKATSSSADWINQNTSYYAIPLAAGYITPPVKNTNYYVGFAYNLQLATSISDTYVYALQTSKIKKFRGIMNMGSIGATETSSLYIRVNNTTDYLVATGAFNQNWTYSFNANLDISLNAGDTFCLKWVTPNWATAPASSALKGMVLLEY